MPDVTDHARGQQPSHIRITVVIQNRYTLDAHQVTGRQIKETANIPADFSLHRRLPGGTESIPDDEPIEVHSGDHFFAQPRSQPAVGHNEEP